MDLTTEDLLAKYKEAAPQYDRQLKTMDLLFGMKRKRKDVLSRASGKVLAVGIGTGQDLPFYPQTCDITGIDLSPDMLILAQKKADGFSRTIMLRQMDAEALAFSNESFDTVVSTLALCTFLNPVKALKELRRVCRRGGKILLLEHGRSSVGFLSWLQDRLAHHPLKKVGCHWNREPLALAQEAKLKILNVKTSNFGIITIIEALPY